MAKAVAVTYLEERYAPLLRLLRRADPKITFARSGETDYVLWMPGLRATLSHNGRPLPDRLEEVGTWRVNTPTGTQNVPARVPLALLAADLIAAAK